MKSITDGERDILREQEQDVRGLEPDNPLVEDLIAALADIHATAGVYASVEDDPTRRDEWLLVVRTADAAIRKARGV